MLDGIFGLTYHSLHIINNYSQKYVVKPFTRIAAENPIVPINRKLDGNSSAGLIMIKLDGNSSAGLR